MDRILGGVALQRFDVRWRKSRSFSRWGQVLCRSS